MNLTKISIIIIILIIELPLFSQTIDREKYSLYGFRLHYGSMIIHSRALKDIGNAYPIGADFSFISQSAGTKAWESCNCFPRKGMTFSYWYFDKPEILGNGYTLNFFIEPVFGGWRKYYFSLKAALGVAYLTKPYHPETNPYNFSYSTLISFPLHLGGTINYTLSEKFNLNLTLIYNHISNGGLREPNKGINWPTIAFGVDYKPRPFELSRNEKQKFDTPASNLYGFTGHLFGTLKQLSHEQLTKYFIGGMLVNADRRISRLSALSLGGQFEWDESDREEISRNGGTVKDHKKAGILAGHQFLLGKFIFSQALGIYVYDKYKANDALYQLYGLTYTASKKYIFGIRLKAHRHEADYLAIEAGIRLI